MRRSISIGLGVSVLFLVAGCGGDRGPAEPERSVDPIVYVPLTPELVRDYIEMAMEMRIPEPNYRRSLAGPPDDKQDSFAYLPDANAEANAPAGFYTGWDKAREVHFIIALLDSSVDSLQKVTLDFSRFSDDPDFQATTNLRRFDVEYVLTLTYLDGNASTEWVTRYGGIAKWDFAGGDFSFWTLSRWKDIAPLEDSSNPVVGTMGTLRAVVGP
jgi:hypothetical protein